MSLGWWKDSLINWGKKSLIFLCVFAVLAWLRFMNEDVAWNMLTAKIRVEDTWRATWRENNPDAKKNDGDIFYPDFVAWFEYWYGSPPSVPQAWLDNLEKEYIAGRLFLTRKDEIEMKASSDAEKADTRRTVWIEDHPESNPFNGLEIPPDVLKRMEMRSSGAQAQQLPPSLPPVKLNTESTTPLSRERIRQHEDMVRSLLN